jgi:hypothetical protein
MANTANTANTAAASSSAGEIGDTVLYRCPGRHSGAAVGQCSGAIHPAIVMEVLSRDSDGAPVWLRLAVMSPGEAHGSPTIAAPKLEQVEAARGSGFGEWQPRGA